MYLELGLRDYLLLPLAGYSLLVPGDAPTGKYRTTG
jgi:hypothetical protein